MLRPAVKCPERALSCETVSLYVGIWHDLRELGFLKGSHGAVGATISDDGTTLCWRK